MRRAGFVAFFSVLALCMHAESARAQDKASLAETLFRDGKSLIEAGNYEVACPKLAESERLDPASGTMLALAYCYEKAGKTASAWSAYTEAASLARRDGVRERAEAATARAKALEPHLVKLRVKVPDSVRALEALEIVIGALPLASAAWGIDVPVDPGAVKITARAKGHMPFETTLTLKEGSAEISIPDLAPVPVASTAPNANPPPNVSTPIASPASNASAPSDPAQGSHGTRRMIGYMTGGAGIVAIGVGSFFGLNAKSTNDSANAACPTGRGCSSDAIQKKSNAETAADTSTVLVSAGLVGVAVGVVLVLVSREPKAEKTSVKRTFVVPLLTQNGGGIGLSGSF